MHINNNPEDSILSNNHGFMVIPYTEHITKAAKLSIKNIDLRLGLRNLNRSDRFIKVYKDVVSKKQCSGLQIAMIVMPHT